MTTQLTALFVATTCVAACAALAVDREAGAGSCGAASSPQVTLLDSQRTVQASASATGAEPSNDAASSSNFGSFSESSGALASGSASASGTASQFSCLGAGLIEGVGGVSSSANSAPGAEGGASASSTLMVTFQVLVPTPYAFSGQVTATCSQQFSGLPCDLSHGAISLEDAGGRTVFSVFARACDPLCPEEECGCCFPCGSDSEELTGMLVPGVYTLTAEAACSAFSESFQGISPTGASFSFDLELLPPPVLYVKAQANGAGTGASWDDAYPTLGAALAAAQFGDQIWVAAGTYKPAGPGGSRESTFALPDGCALFGGFSGNESSLSERDPSANPTILSGDLSGNDGIPGSGLGIDENAYHVITAEGVSGLTVLDGFSIVGGNANGVPGLHDRGGGLKVVAGAPAVRRCRFLGNFGGSFKPDEGGGGAAFLDGDHSEEGGALFEGCVFERNTAPFGGAINALDSTFRLLDCRFFDNVANYGGAVSGGTGLAPVEYQMVNCLFHNNFASHVGGAVALIGSIDLINCTVVGNVATNISGTTGSGGIYVFLATKPLRVRNSILWNNVDSSPQTTTEQAQILASNGATGTVVSSSIIQGWTGALGGEGNSGDDPLFVDPDGADNDPGTADDDFRLERCSPAVDAADAALLPEAVATDLDGNPRHVDGDGDGVAVLDMGPYENQRNVAHPADFDGNGAVDGADLGALLASWGACLGCPADLDCDGLVTGADLGQLLADWG